MDGPLQADLLAAWHRVHDAVGKACGWDAATRTLPSAFVLAHLPSAQGKVSKAVGDARGAAFLSACDLASRAGRRSAARLRSAAVGAASAWLACSPTARATQLSSAAFVAAGRHRLGHGPASAVAAPPCMCDAGSAPAPDHGMTCTGTAGARTMRHDIMASAWRRVIRKAGCGSSAEPAYAGLAGDARAAARAGLRRGDICARVGTSILVLDVVITHPAASSYVGAASSTSGSAARRAEQDKRREFARMGDGGGYEFVPLAAETYGRLGLSAARFLSGLGDVVAASGGSKAAFVRFARSELSCALVRGNSLVYDAALNAVLRAAGRGYLPGCPVPVEDAVDE